MSLCDRCAAAMGASEQARVNLMTAEGTELELLVTHLTEDTHNTWDV